MAEKITMRRKLGARPPVPTQKEPEAQMVRKPAECFRDLALGEQFYLVFGNRTHGATLWIKISEGGAVPAHVYGYSNMEGSSRVHRV